MKLKTFGSILAAAVLLSACSGGGSGNSAVPAHPQQAAGTARGTITFTYSRSAAHKIASALKNPKYISAGTQYADVFINGIDVNSRVACAPGNTGSAVVDGKARRMQDPGTTGACTLSWVAPAGTVVDGVTPANFALEVDDNEFILAEGAKSVVLNPGENDFGMTLNGHADVAYISGAGDGSGGDLTITVGDADGYVIAASADPNETFDNPPVVTFTYSQPGGGTPPQISSVSGNWSAFAGEPLAATLNAPDNQGNDYSLHVTCGSKNGNFTVTLAAGNASGIIGSNLLSNFNLSFDKSPGDTLFTLSANCQASGTATFQ